MASVDVPKEVKQWFKVAKEAALAAGEIIKQHINDKAAVKHLSILKERIGVFLPI